MFSSKEKKINQGISKFESCDAAYKYAALFMLHHMSLCKSCFCFSTLDGSVSIASNQILT